eukprot:TRINITY_DN24687_c0_g1_i1.p1 TRINITY_DN24687_c0_g1~~TRINITY_DN24687_c0_g1_i1.p1  ORF type:complete len:614 (-),score=141.90 TRINITY_DN24687_c0_g1_i1:184-1794(-)
MAEDLTLAMFDGVLNKPLQKIDDNPVEGQNDSHADEVASLQAEREQLQAELASIRSEMDFQILKEQELEHRNEQANKTIQEMKRQLDASREELHQANKAHEAAQTKLASVNEESLRLEQLALKLQSDNRDLCDQLALAQAATEESQRQLSDVASPEGGDGDVNLLSESLRDENLNLRERVSTLESELSNMQTDLSMRKDNPTTSTTELPPHEKSEEAPLLAAAYQQISVLNTQLAQLYTELTITRTEALHLRNERSAAESGGAVGGEKGDKTGNAAGAVDVQKQSQQIADLVSDIRHLQLDLEYHQQKLDQMIEEKQQMMRDLKKSQVDLTEARRQVEERDQMLKHREVDLAQLKQEARASLGEGEGSAANEATLAALRAEAAAKDSALIVSHYELHKEKLVRDRLEQKNFKLMERMQKLMMVVETMRKDNVNLERSLAARERSHDEKDLQLRQMTSKAKQLQKMAKASSRSGQKDGSITDRKYKGASMELEVAPSQSLPPLERSQRSGDSIGGRRSGMSTPRTPRRSAESPYLTR